MFSNDLSPHGSADVAAPRNLKREGLLRPSPSGVMAGFMGKHPIFIPGQGGMVTIGGARTQKLASVLGYSHCGFGYQGNTLTYDNKGEAASICQTQFHTNKHSVFWNPFRLNGIPHDCINMLGHLKLSDPAVIPKLALSTEAIVPLSGSANGKHFERLAWKIANGIGITCLELFDEMTFPDWIHAINLVIRGGEDWDSFAARMRQSRFSLAREAEAEIAEGRANDGGGFRGAMGELAQATQAFSDPLLMDAVSGPFDWSYEELLSQTERFNVYLMVPSEYVSLWDIVIRMHFTCAFSFKSEAPSAPEQLWIIDEAATLGTNPMLERAFSIGAGMGIKPWAVFQSLEQMNRIGKGAKDIILSSAAVRQFFGIRDLESARTVSAMCGVSSLSYDDKLQQMQAAKRKHHAALGMMNGKDFMQTALAYRHEAEQERHRALIRRPLRTPDEILNTPAQGQYIFCDQIKKVIYCERRPYYEQHWMAGKFHPNPFYGPSDKVRIKNRWVGHSWRKVLTMDPPPRLRHLRQYRNRPVSYIEGFAP